MPTLRSSTSTRWWVFAAVLAADVLDLLDSTVTTIAAPTIVRDLHAPPSLTPWLGLSYALMLGSLLVVGGRLGDRFGQRRMFLIGLVGFTAASLACSVAFGPVALIAARLVQGAFGALLIPQGFSLLLRAFPREQLGSVFGLFGPLMALSAISGPVVAALLIEVAPFGLGWRVVFLLNVLLGVALLGIASVVLPRDAGDRSVVIDPVSSMLVAAGLLGVLGGVVSGSEQGWNATTLVPTALGAALLAGFVVRERRSAHPLLAPSLFRNRGFVAGVTVGTIFFAAVAGLMYVTSLHLQQSVGLTVLQTAGVMAPVSVGIIATSFPLRSRVARLGRRLVLVGVLLTLAGVAALALVVVLAPAAGILLAGPLLLCGLGMGCCFGSIFSTALGDVDESEAGSASGTLNALQQVSNAIGAALVSTVFLVLLTGAGATPATVASLGLVAVVLLACVAAAPLLPRHGADEHH